MLIYKYKLKNLENCLLLCLLIGMIVLCSFVNSKTKTAMGFYPSYLILLERETMTTGSLIKKKYIIEMMANSFRYLANCQHGVGTL